MRAWFSCAVIALLAASVVLTPPALARTPSGGSGHVPPAALAAEPPLPAPAVWPFGEDFPRISGTGRYAGGAHFWTDFLYDDNGAAPGLPIGTSVGSVSFGGFRYPEPEQHNNGADIFRAAIGLTAADTWWRVDWNTLADPSVPIAAFAIDADADPATGSATWPAGAGVRSDGIDVAVVVSGTGAWIVDATSGESVAVADVGGDAWVDLESRSFVARVPRAALDLAERSIIRLAAGLADPSGERFLDLGLSHGALPIHPNVYNVGFRSIDAESPMYNFWMDRAQAFALALGDVTPFAIEVDWGRLAAGETDPEPDPRGYLNRWYVSSIELGHGATPDLAGSFDGAAAYLGRVQPYAIYVPHSYERGTPAPLTFVLHSLTLNHNQYGATAPRLLDLACEQRGSICVTPLGRGPDGFYRDEAELDFWEVWADVARTYDLDPERTTLGGYSMGGIGTARLAVNHPDLFAGVFVLAATAGAVRGELANLRWVPYYQAHGALDQLVNFTEPLADIAALDALDQRYVFDLYPAEDHAAYFLKDGFDPAAEFLAREHERVRDPGRIVYHLRGGDVDDDLGIGPRGAWWLADVRARDGDRGLVQATSHARPDASFEVARSEELRPLAVPSPALRQVLAWTFGERPEPAPLIELHTAGIDRLRLDLEGAGLHPFADGARVLISTDGVTLTLAPLPDGAFLIVNGEPVDSATVTLDEGDHEVTFGRIEAAPVDTQDPPLPATGGGAAATLVLLLAAAAAQRMRR